MATRYYVVILKEGFQSWQQNELQTVYFLRKVLRHLGYWPGEQGSATQLNVVVARLVLGICSIWVIWLCPMSIYTFFGNLDKVILVIGLQFVASMVVLHAVCLLRCTADFEDAFAKLSVMADARSRHFAQPAAILAQHKRTSFPIMLYFESVCGVFLPSFEIALTFYSVRYRAFFVTFWFPYDPQQSPLFELSYLLWFVATFNGVLLMNVVNTLLMSLLAEAVKHLQVLNYNLRLIVELTKVSQDQKKNPPLAGVETYVTVQPRADPPEIATGVSIRSLGGLSKDASRIKLRPRSLPQQNAGQRILGVTRIKPVVNQLARSIRKKAELNRRLEANLKTCVVHHQAILSFVAATHRAFDLILLHQLILSIAPTIVGIIYVTYSPHYDWRVLSIFGLVVGCLIGQGLFCWLADKVGEESILLRDAVYSCDWFDQSESFKQSMRIMMSRCNEPLVIKIFGFVPLTLATFHSVLNLMYSYYMSINTALARPTN